MGGDPLQFPEACSSLRSWAGLVDKSCNVDDRRPTHRNIRGLRRVFPVIEQQAFLRVIALSRTDLDRERILVPPRWFALLHWPFPLLRGVWISAEFPVHLGFILFLFSMCTDAPDSATNSRSSGLFEVGACIVFAAVGV